SIEKLNIVLEKYLPGEAVTYCANLWLDHKFDFKVTRKRATKLGDYRYYFQTKRHCITINGDLNPYAFLVTYLHEVAHLKTNLAHGMKIKPHGTEWKNNFSALLIPVKEIFPEVILEPLEKYIKNPKASSCSDFELLKALSSFDDHVQGVFLSDVSAGEIFTFNKRVFVKEEKRRTRSLCKEVKTGRKYLIPDSARIIPVTQNLGQSTQNIS
ncbi:MAG: transcription elongation protein SprT, partial [Cytophagaceae bacterium]